MQTLFFTVKEWNRFTWSIQEVICKKYDVILTDYKTRKEKTLLLLKINMKNFNKGMDTFNKSLNKFSKTVDSLTNNKSGFTEYDQGKSMDETLGKTGSTKDAIWSKPVRLNDSPVSIWPEKPTRTESDKLKRDHMSIWGKRDDG